MTLSTTSINPRRKSRAGKFRLDIFFMCFLLVALCAVTYLAFASHTEATRDEIYVAKHEALAKDVTHSLTLASDSLDEAFASAGISAADFKSLQERMAEESHSFRQADGANFTDGTAKLGSPENVVDALNRYDGVINSLIAARQTFPGLKTLMEARNTKAYEDYAAVLKEKKDELDQKITDILKAIKDASDNVVTASSGSQDERVAAFERAESDFKREIRKIRDRTLGTTADERKLTLTQAMKLIEEDIATVEKLRRNMLEVVSDGIGREAAKNDFKGFVMAGDETNEWAWINLSQSDNVRRGIAFDVQRPAKDGSGMMEVARIQVDQVLPGGGSRCRVTSTVAGRFPMRGDSLVQKDFTTEKYKYYSLIGDFGGEFSRFSRSELKNMLLARGYVVHNIPSAQTQVLIVGRNWRVDPRLAKLLKEEDNDATFPRHMKINERDLLYQFELIGPASR